jgi:hypothetical protein
VRPRSSVSSTGACSQSRVFDVLSTGGDVTFGLIFAQMGLATGVFDAGIFSAVTLMVMVTRIPGQSNECRSRSREATVHQSATGDLAIRQGAWKLIFHQDGRRELFDVIDDLSETRDMFAANPEVASKLTVLMQSYIDRGRSTPGEVQKNEVGFSAAGERPMKKSRNKGKIK